MVNIYHIWAVSLISGVSQSMPTQPDTWCCVGMTTRCQETLLRKVFTSSIMKVKLLLNAVVSCYYITLWTICKGLPANTLQVFCFPPRQENHLLLFFISFVFLCMQYGAFFAEKQDFTFKMFYFFFLLLIVNKKTKNSHWKHYKKGKN